MKKIILIIVALISVAVGSFFLYSYVKERNIKKTLININSAIKSAKVNKPLEICGWMPWWDMKDSVNEYNTHKNLNVISPFIYLLNEDGTITNKLTSNDFESIKNLQNVQIIPTIYNDFDPDRVSLIINNPEKSQKHIEDIVKEVSTNNWAGIELDYEYLKSADKDAYSEFVEKLSESLKPINKKLIVTLHAKTSDIGTWDSAKAQDWVRISKAADTVRIMAYDFHYKDSGPGPIAPLNWLRDVTSYAKTTIPKNKRVLAIGLYGYEWIGDKRAKDYTLSQISDTIANTKETPSFDENVKAPFYEYEKSGKKHIIWYEDVDSIKEKINIAKDYSGICFWRIGGIPDDIYEILPTPESSFDSTSSGTEDASPI